MNGRFWLAFASVLWCTSALAQGQGGVQGSASAGAQGSVQAGDKQASTALAGGSELNVTLTKPVDAGKSKPGDEVTATVAQDVKSGGHVVIPRGSKLIGRVTEAKPRGSSSGGGSASGSAAGNAAGTASGTAAAAADASSRLGVVFDRAVLRNGREVPLNATVQAVAAAKTAASTSGANSGVAGAGGASGAGRASGGGLLGGAGAAAGGVLDTAGSVGGAAAGTVGATAGAATSASAGAVGGLNAAGHLASGSRGVFNMKGLNIQSASSGSGQASVITSKSRNVRLEGGTQMLLSTSTGAAGSAQNADESAGSGASAPGGTPAGSRAPSGERATQER